MSESNADWLLRRQFEERGTTVRTLWDIYLRFYAAFLALNVTGIGVVVATLEDPLDRWPIAIAFALHNLLTVGSVWFITNNSRELIVEMEDLAKALGSDSKAEMLPGAALKAPLPLKVIRYTGPANMITHIGFMIIWVLLPLL